MESELARKFSAAQNSSTGHAPVKCFGCISPPRPAVPSAGYTQGAPPQRANLTNTHSYTFIGSQPSSASSLFRDSCPTGTGPPHQATILTLRFVPVESFFVLRASLLYQCYAPTTASRKATGGGAASDYFVSSCS